MDNGQDSAYRADIEGLRGIAVVSVLAFHAGVPGFRGGFVGVDIFFVISGFLITGLMIRCIEASPSPSMGQFLLDFYARRAKRILPAATAVLLATLIVAALVQNPIENATLYPAVRAAAFFFANEYFAAEADDYFNDGAFPSPVRHFWSLSLEEQFYFVAPLAIVSIATWARKRFRGWLIIALASVAIFSFLSCQVVLAASPTDAFYRLPTRAWELSVGGLLACLPVTQQTLSQRTRHWLQLSGLGLVIGSIAGIRESSFPDWRSLAPVFGTVLLLFAGTKPKPVCRLPVSAVLATRMLQATGRYSFSLYLWHWPMLTIKVEHLEFLYGSWGTRVLLLLCGTLPLSALTYHLLENPVRRNPWLVRSPKRSVAMGASLALLAGGSAFGFHKWTGREQLSATDQATALLPSISYQVSPTPFVPSNLRPPLLATRPGILPVDCDSLCVGGVANRDNRVAVFGNSHARHWAPAFLQAAHGAGVSVEVFGAGGCSAYPIDTKDINREQFAACERLRTQIWKRLQSAPPSLLVVSNLTNRQFAENRDEWLRAVRSTLRRATRITRVLVLSETPAAITSVPLCLAQHISDTYACDVHWPAALNGELKRISEEEGAVFVDLRSRFCSKARCPAITDNVLIYRDRNHITREFALAQVPWLASLLSQQLHRTAGGR